MSQDVSEKVKSEGVKKDCYPANKKWQLVTGSWELKDGIKRKSS